MTPEGRFAALVAASFVLWLPALRAMVYDDLDPSVAGVRYVAGFLVAWVGVRFLSVVISGYSIAVAEHDGEVGHGDGEAVVAAVPNRRRGDPVA